MILSTSELVPVANIAGIQARVVRARTPPYSYVRRVEDERLERPLIPRTPALINPRDPSRLLLAVGEVQEVSPRSTTVLSTPFLQTFDIAYNHNISRQALTRTNVTNKLISPNAHRICQAVVTHIQISYDGMWLVTVDDWLPPKRDIEFLGRINVDGERRRRREVYLKFWQWKKSDESWELVTRIDAPHAMAGENYGAGRVLSLASDSSSLAFSTIGEDGIVQIWCPRSRKRDGIVVRGADGEPLYTWSCQRQIPLGSTELCDARPVPQIPKHACLAFSEDGSLLAAAISEDGVIHLIDPLAGTIRTSHPTMYRGELIGFAFLAQYFIILSEDLRVYDLVLNEQKYIVSLDDTNALLSLGQKVEMMHLTVDQLSRTFAVALPRIVEGKSIAGADTNIMVYQPEHAEPIYTKALPSLVTAFIPAISSAGYIVLDAAAEITTVSPKASQTLISIAKPMVELRLDIRTEEQPMLDLLQLADNAEVDDIEIDGANISSSFGTEDDGPPAVSQYQLTSIFDIGPSFTLPPIEELFYKVAGLLSSKSTTKVS
jgi:NET1-associated nuclear protein 1 (U3 small nucleolar RNA-associated protein 17)